MEDLKLLLAELLEPGKLLSFTLSSPVGKGPDTCLKVTGRPVVIRGATVIQLERIQGTNATHVNLSSSDAAAQIVNLLAGEFRQAHIRATDGETHIRIGKDGRPAISRKRISAPAIPPAPQAHDRRKVHLIPEGVPCPFLHRLGVMTERGSVIAAQRDKFRQVNRFLDIVAGVVDELDMPARNVVDFGCGKAYLTFAIHHYLTNIRGLAASVVGIDRRPDVIITCQEVAEEIGAERIQFEVGDIESAAGSKTADMVVALHACDTATDAALARAVQMDARVILAAPCCQHELNRQLENPALRLMLKHGIIRETLTGLVTDSLRSALLEAHGYRTALVEFVDPVHTPKNILLRAVRRDKSTNRESALREYESLRDFWHVRPALERLLAEWPPATIMAE